MGNVLSAKGQYVATSNLLNATVSNGNAYLAAGYDGLVILNVSKTNAPQLASQLDLGYVSNVAVLNKTAFCLTNEGLKTVDISNPSKPALIATADFTSLPQAIVLKNKTAFISDWNNGLVIADISDVKNVRLVTQFSITNAKTIALSPNGKMIAVVSDETDVVLVNVSNATPNRVSSLNGLNFKDAVFINDL